MPGKRDVNVDFIRILSCIGVVGLHCFQEVFSAGNLFVYRLCGFAIPMFFVTSGYFLAKRENNLQRILAKIIRILMIIILWNLILWVILTTKDIITSQQIDILFLPKSILKSFIQQGRFWHFWYLAALILVYTILPFISRFIAKNQKQRLLTLWVVFLLIGVVLQLLSEFVFHQSIQRLVVQPLRLWTWLQYFLLGGVLRISQDKWKGRKVEAMTAAIVMTIVVQLWQNLMGNQIHVLYGEAFYDSITTVLWVTAIFIFLMNLNITSGLKRFIEITAPCTMGVYIIHPLLIRYMKRLLFPDTFIKSIGLFVILSAVSFGITYVLRKIPWMKKLVSL